MEPSAATTLGQLAAELADTAGPALPGTLTVRSYACGKRRCRCHASPPQLHGPYAEWTRKIEGKTITRRLTPEQLAAWQPLFDNARKMRDLLARIQDLTLQTVDADHT
jgi:hypothetical protein